mmetsp:Transcript_17403/g.48917  ORF Transcript_17403/g.48917 Transcript_17403/m.48917 type:complete len:228 (+) Transcript_17403:114-797(+)
MSRNFLVAIDDSENSEWAFNFAISIMKKEDTLHLITVRNEDVNTSFGLTSAYAYDLMVKAREQERHRCRALLRRFARKAHNYGMDHPVKLTMGAGHIGDIICGYCKEEKVDFLIMGRRGMGTVKRLFLGSNSKYCIEEADTNVIVIKHPYGPPEVHESKLKEVIDAEEEERKWRIEEYQKKLEKEAKEREAESKKDLELVKKMEEEERLRRESDDVPTRSISGRAND